MADQGLIKSDWDVYIQIPHNHQLIGSMLKQNESNIISTVHLNFLSNPNGLTNIYTVIDGLCANVSMHNNNLQWTESLDYRGVNWVYCNLSFFRCSKHVSMLGNDVSSLNSYIDCALFEQFRLSVQLILQDDFLVSMGKIEEQWVEYSMSVDQFHWLKHEGFDADQWAYSYIHNSEYLNIPSPYITS